MRQTAINSALALLMAASAPLGAVSVASAQITLELDEDGPRVRLDDDDRRERERDRREDLRREERREARRTERGCSEDGALAKAERMGIRRARIDDSDRRSIDVRGRDRRGDRVFVTFGRQPGCPVLR